MSGSNRDRPARESRAPSGEGLQFGDLLPDIYDELRRVAGRQMRRERAGQTLQATALVHEAWLRLMRAKHLQLRDRTHAIAIAARAMRQILVERARARAAQKRGGGSLILAFHEAASPAGLAPVDVLALNEALDRLAGLDPLRAQVVELRLFGGLTIDEAAEALDRSPATVKRAWSLAFAWLRRELEVR